MLVTNVVIFTMSVGVPPSAATILTSLSKTTLSCSIAGPPSAGVFIAVQPEMKSWFPTRTALA